MKKNGVVLFEAFKQLLKEANDSGYVVLHSVLKEDGYHLVEISERSLNILERDINPFGNELKIIQSHQKLIFDEKHEWDVKAAMMSEFIGNSPMFDSIDPEEQELMKEQCEIMWQYSEILGNRISIRFKNL